MPAAFAFSNEGWMPFGSSGQMRIMVTFFWIAAFIATIWACGLYCPPIVSKSMPESLGLQCDAVVQCLDRRVRDHRRDEADRVLARSASPHRPPASTALAARAVRSARARPLFTSSNLLLSRMGRASPAVGRARRRELRRPFSCKVDEIGGRSTEGATVHDRVGGDKSPAEAQAAATALLARALLRRLVQHRAHLLREELLGLHRLPARACRRSGR